MHASIWKFTGDADDLAHRYDALLDEMPTAEFVVHLCLRAPDGIVIIDTCPTREVFEAFALGDQFRSALRRHGLPNPTELHDYPVHVAFVNGTMPVMLT
jgi:hypothetical protein